MEIGGTSGRFVFRSVKLLPSALLKSHRVPNLPQRPCCRTAPHDALASDMHRPLAARGAEPTDRTLLGHTGKHFQGVCRRFARHFATVFAGALQGTLQGYMRRVPKGTRTGLVRLGSAQSQLGTIPVSTRETRARRQCTPEVDSVYARAVLSTPHPQQQCPYKTRALYP
jgi:hypothetical protein